MDALEPQLRELLEAHKAFFKLTDNGKIECTLNGHTLPARLDAVSSFIQGAKFQKLSRRQAADTALQKYEPFIVQSKNFPLMLYCALTGQLIDKSVEAVKKHMKGKKFQRAKDRFASDDLELKPEPSLESFGVRPNKAAAATAAVVKQTKQQPQEEVNGAAAGSEEEPGFWVPEGAESGSSEEGEGEEEEEEGSDAAGSSDDGDLDMEAAAGPSDSEEDDPMDEDTDAAAAAAAAEAAAAAAAAKASKSSSKAAGGKTKQKQKQGSSKAGKAAAQNGSAAAGATKKRNAQRPSAAKKARH